MIKNFLHTSLVALIATSVAFGDVMADNCKTKLANEIADIIIREDVDDNTTIVIVSDMLVDFFAENIEDCRDYLLRASKSGKNIERDTKRLVMDINWPYLVGEVAAKLSLSDKYRVLYVCENDRAYQGAIDAGLWAATVIAAAYSFGTGGVAVQGGKTAIVEGAKGIVKVGVKKGATKAAVEAVSKKVGLDVAGKAAAQKAAEETAKAATKKAATNAVIIQTRASLEKAGTTAVTDDLIAAEIRNQIARNTTGELAKRQAKNATLTEALAIIEESAAATAAVTEATAAATSELALASKALASAYTKFALSTPIAAGGGIASVYSYLESGLNPTVMNCTNTDKNTGCYTSCTKDSLVAPMDDLNVKVFKPLFGKNLCVDENSNYALREIIPSSTPRVGKIFVTDDEKWVTIKRTVMDKVADQGNCDWHMDDIDMYVSSQLFDETTLRPTGQGNTGLIKDAVRLDE